MKPFYTAETRMESTALNVGTFIGYAIGIVGVKVTELKDKASSLFDFSTPDPEPWTAPYA